ncbi:hypothetical protein DQ353_17225 [Arthrobacter sp. AQ5-05]|nr:hypothetical protein DQ353_17225 [Arthrobacter sp. AQ5-05]
MLALDGPDERGARDAVFAADTVVGLLHRAGFSLQSNAKTREGDQGPDRDAQFRYFND